MNNGETRGGEGGLGLSGIEGRQVFIHVLLDCTRRKGEKNWATANQTVKMTLRACAKIKELITGDFSDHGVTGAWCQM
jgi:hypothetical protein